MMMQRRLDRTMNFYRCGEKKEPHLEIPCGFDHQLGPSNIISVTSRGHGHVYQAQRTRGAQNSKKKPKTNHLFKLYINLENHLTL